MNTTENKVCASASDDSRTFTRLSRVETVACLAGGTAFFVFIMLDNVSLGGGIAAAAACGMVAFVCHSILKYP